jgi:hypothetical protein
VIHANYSIGAEACVSQDVRHQPADPPMLYRPDPQAEVSTQARFAETAAPVEVQLHERPEPKAEFSYERVNREST